MYACPWCERRGFSFWQKQSLVPSRTVDCSDCRRQVSVPWTRSHLAALPIFVFGLAGLWFVGDAFNSKLFALVGALGGGAIGMLIAIPLYHYLVPLVKPEKK